MRFCLLFLSLLLFSSLAATTINFHQENALAIAGQQWMFDSDASEPFICHYNSANWHPIVVFKELCDARHRYPFVIGSQTFYNNITTSYASSWTAFPPLASVTQPDTTLHYRFGDKGSAESYALLAFQHINTINPGQNWATYGQAGDFRFYGGAAIELLDWNYGNNYLRKLRVKDCYCTNLVSYPGPLGSNAPLQGHGWGQIDFANSDPSWASYFNAKNGMVEFDFNSFSMVVQTVFGQYTSDVTLRNATIVRNSDHGHFGGLPSDFNSINTNDLRVQVSSGANYATQYLNPSVREHNVYTNRTMEAPAGTFPSEIDKVYQKSWWEAGICFDYFTADVTFDFSVVQGVDNPANLRILYKPFGNSTAWSTTNATVISTNPLMMKLSNQTGLGQYCLASTGGNNLEVNRPLQVELLRDAATANLYYLQWQPVSGAAYYNVYAADSPDASESPWTRIAHLEAPLTMWSGSELSSHKFYFVKAEK
jgi:hypothetical protein